METIDMFRDLAIILIVAKCFGLLARKLHAPQVVGEIIAGLIIGPSILGWVQSGDFLTQMAEIGVILLMFSAGLETDLHEMVKTGPVALIVALAGVIVPLAGGYAVYSAFYGWGAPGSDTFYSALFMGVILTATSVSITVQTLRELGKLKGRVGTTIMSAAIIDDVIGILVLTFVIGFKDPMQNPGQVVLSTVLFFLICGVFGVLCYKGFKFLDKKYPHRRRIAIYGLALCFLLAYVAEKFFGIADITGAYVAGIILCNIRDSSYIAQKMDISSYMLFGPIFFASIGLKTQIDGITPDILWFTVCFIVVALLGKIIGCGGMAKLCKFNAKDSLRIGVGMMNRGEVALIVAQKGLAAGMVQPVFFSSVIILIMVAAITTPIIMKLLYRKEPPESQEPKPKPEPEPMKSYL